MSCNEIKELIDKNNKRIEELFDPTIFTLNVEVEKLRKENAELASQCTHEFCFGKCKYCYTENPELNK